MGLHQIGVTYGYAPEGELEAAEAEYIAVSYTHLAGVEPDLVFAALRGGLAGSVVLDAKVPMMLQGNDKPGFKIDLPVSYTHLDVYKRQD